MGALTPVLTYLPMIQEGVRLISGISGSESSYNQSVQQQKLALQQLRARQNLEEQQAAEDAALERERMEADAEDAEAMRLAALRRAVARQRVDFASRGLNANDDGTAEAILLGLFEETDADRAARERLDDIRNRAINANLSQGSALNVLQRTQLQQKQKLDRMTSDRDQLFDRVNSGLETIGYFDNVWKKLNGQEA